MKKVQHIDGLKIEDFIDSVSNTIVSMYSSGDKVLTNLEFNLQQRIKSKVREGLTNGKLGEILAATWMLKNGYEIGWSNIRISQPGKREEDGVDLIAKKLNQPFFVEIKTGYISNKIDSVVANKNSAFVELKKRMDKKSDYIYSADKISWIDPQDQMQYKALIDSIQPLALIQTKAEINRIPYIGKEFNIQMLILIWEKLTSWELELVGSQIFKEIINE